MRRYALLLLAIAVIAGNAHAESELVIAIRYLHAQGTSHSHLYLYREDGKLLRQLTNDNSGQDSSPIFSPDGETIVFTREKPNNVREFWSVNPRGTDLKKLDARPDWYAQAKSSPYFTNVEPQEAGSADATSSPAESASPTATPASTYKSPDAFIELGNADSASWRTRLSHIHGESLRSHPREQKDGELLLYRALGREAESHSLCARKIRCALLRDVNVSTQPYAERSHVAPKLGVKTESPQARERGKPREDPHALQKLTRDETVSMHFGRSAFGVRCVLASLLLLTSLGFSAAVQAQPDSPEQLADDFWAWRAKHGPFTADDVNRMERPGGRRDWSRASIDRRRKDLAGFEARWKKLDPAQWPLSKQVDYKLIGSALARVRWELEVNPRWKRDPNFYIEQTLAALAEALSVPAPYDEAHSREILTRIENIPSILQQGAENLTEMPSPFASVAIQNLDGIRERLGKMVSALAGATTLKEKELKTAAGR